MKISNRKFYASALLVSALLAGGASFYASSSPDGLEKVAEDIGFIALPVALVQAAIGPHLHAAAFADRLAFEPLANVAGAVLEST